jgi:hypothetical protein
MLFTSAEALVEHLRLTKLTGDEPHLSIADPLYFAGEPDQVGFGMALVVDSILAQGYEPNGFEQRDGFRVYRYKLME